MEILPVRTKVYIKNSYAELLLYYYKTGVGNKSEVTGAIITENMINTIERRYKELGGNPVVLKLKEYTPSKNGTDSQHDN